MTARVDASAEVLAGPGPGLPRAALVVAAVLAALLVVVIAVTTPWRPLGDVPGGATPVDPARDFSLAERAAAAAYQSAVVPPVVLGLLAGLVVSVVLGLTPLGAGLVSLAGRPFGGGWIVTVLAGTALLVVVGRVATLPLDLWAASVRRSEGLLTQPWPAWALDQAKALGLTVVLVSAAMTALVSLARAWPRGWWVAAAAGAAVLVVGLSFLYPVVVEPLFARFTPMPAGPQRDSLLELAERDGVPVSDVLVADASARGTALNAYVSGFGSTRRLVVFDTLLERTSPEEVRAVVAHELGHAARRDVLWGTLLGAVGAALAVVLVAIAVSWPPLLARAGATGPGDPRVVALVLAVAAVLAAVAAPAQNLVSRRVEARADVHALDLTGDPAALALLHKRLAVANRSALDPPAWRYLWLSTHPTGPQRIGATRDWARIHGAAEPPDLADVEVSGPR